MTTYIQKTNKNSFTLRYKKYKKLGSDLWGRIAFVNKKNDFTTHMKNMAEQDIKNRIRFLSKQKKRRIQKRFRLRRKAQLFQYTVLEKPKRVRRNRITARSKLRVLRKKIKAFYYLRLTQKSIRKLVGHRKFRRSNSKNVTSSFLETRFDVMLYRLNFISSIYEGRRIIKTKKAFVLGPSTKTSNHKFFSTSTMRKAYHQIPIFYFITLNYKLALHRKIYLKNIIYAWKLIAYPPSYLLASYKTMIGLRLNNPKVQKIRYPFRGSLAHFIGAALYF
jgi:hypothetical protein